MELVRLKEGSDLGEGKSGEALSGPDTCRGMNRLARQEAVCTLRASCKAPKCGLLRWAWCDGCNEQRE
jgi:hypothetical protein